MTFLCLDLGTTTGWAHHHKGVTTSGSECFKPKRFEGGGMRYLRFAQWLEAVTAQKPDYIFYEEVRRHNSTDASHVYGGLMATLTAFCEAQNIPYMGVPVGAIKKHATGKGNAGKPAMIEAMRAKGHTHLTDTDDDEADALALMYLKMEHSPF